MRVTSHVSLRGENGYPLVLAPGDRVPDWALGRISPRLLEGDDAPPVSAPAPDVPAVVSDGEAFASAVSRPPIAGRGSGLEAWQEYAATVGVVSDPCSSRKEIIAACEQLGV